MSNKDAALSSGGQASKRLPVSPLSPGPMPALTPVPGVEVGAVAAGLRYRGRLDLMMARVAKGTRVAGVFTKNEIKAAPVRWCMDALEQHRDDIRALVVNVGSANAFTGPRGASAARRVAEQLAGIEGCAPGQVMMASTGVIGEPFSATPVARPLSRLAEGLSGNMWRDAAKAIMTTDTFPKGASRLAEINHHPVVLSGITKGSGMLAPNMATMLGFVFTNANLSADCLQVLLNNANARSFNAMTVDGDTSTNDTVLAFATGVNGGDLITDPDDKRLGEFKRALDDLMQDLAQQLVRDGEGAQKFVTIDISGAATEADAQKVGKAIANSKLVKTAIAGSDPNWGRILMAAGTAGVGLDEMALSLSIGSQLVAANGSAQRAYSEEEAASHMAGQHIKIALDLGMGSARSTVWTCDLTHQYISINADYRS